VLIDASKKISTDISDTVRAQIITHMDGASVSELFNLPDAKSGMPESTTLLGISPPGAAGSGAAAIDVPSPTSLSAANLSPGTPGGGNSVPGTPNLRGMPGTVPETPASRGKKDEEKKKRALPSTPLSRGQALHKAIHKYMCTIESNVLKMSGLRHQEGLRGQMVAMKEKLVTIYNDVGKLVKAGCDTEASYEKHLNLFVMAKNEAQECLAFCFFKTHILHNASCLS
jgi:hypothetical protein